MTRLLTQLQLSNYDSNGNFILECDSGFQMAMGRMRELLKICPDLTIDVIGPLRGRLWTQPECIIPDLFKNRRIRWVEIDILPNALATRYDFNFDQINKALETCDWRNKRYDAIYLNDPMLLRHYRALFTLKAGYVPKIYSHSHFVDNPSNPKFPVDATLWLGQCEAAIRADHNFWQCESTMKVFFNEMKDYFTPSVVEYVRQKSSAWDDGYSIEEITIPPRMNEIRFDTKKLEELRKDKIIVFVPNRIGGKGRSSDYTNCGKFMFEILPELRKINKDFVILAGNPSQKFLNSELEEMCGKDGYVNLVKDAFNRDEYKYIAANSDIVLGLYDNDTYGATAIRECVELGCIPFMLDNYEYSTIAELANCRQTLCCKPDFSNIVDCLDDLICSLHENKQNDFHKLDAFFLNDRLRDVVRNRCSYEKTTAAAAKIMGLL